MRYFKEISDEGYIVAVGCGAGGEEINLFEYNRIKSLLASAPEQLGYEYHLTNEYAWEAVKIDPDELPDDTVKKMFEAEIMASITVDKTKPEGGKIGYMLEQQYDPERKAIAWVYVEDPNYVEPVGTFTNPIAWAEGLEVVAGVNEDYVSDGWYEFDGLVQRCIKDGVPETFTDPEYWEIIA